MVSGGPNGESVCATNPAIEAFLLLKTRFVGVNACPLDLGVDSGVIEGHMMVRVRVRGAPIVSLQMGHALLAGVVYSRDRIRVNPILLHLGSKAYPIWSL